MSNKSRMLLKFHQIWESLSAASVRDGFYSQIMIINKPIESPHSGHADEFETQ